MEVLLEGDELTAAEARAGFRAALGVGRGLRWRRGVKVTWAGVLRSPPADFQAECWNNDRCLFCSRSEPGAESGRDWAGSVGTLTQLFLLGWSSSDTFRVCCKRS